MKNYENVLSKSFGNDKIRKRGMNVEEGKTTARPYDDVFRTLLNDCSSLIIPVINEVFREDYSGKERIVFSPNEHFMNRQDGIEGERVTDTCFKILGREIRKYHLECQSSADSSMLVRFFEYDTQIALDEGELSENVLTVTFPHSAVLFLRCGASTPDKLKIRMVTPGGNLEYGVLVMKLRQFTLDEIFNKNLLFLIPFHIFSHEDRFAAYEQDEAQRRLLEKEYEMVREELEERLEQRVISEYVKCTIIDMSNRVLEHIARKYELVRKGVKEVMGGKVLDYEAKTILNEGMKRGMEKGIEKGMEKGIRGTVSILKNLGIPTQTILSEIQEQYNLSPEASREYL